MSGPHNQIVIFVLKILALHAGCFALRSSCTVTCVNSEAILRTGGGTSKACPTSWVAIERFRAMVVKLRTALAPA